MADNPILLSIFILASSIWIGGLVTVGVVIVSARQSLAERERVAFFRAFGRAYGPVGCVALVVALITGGLLADHQGWSPALAVATVAAAVLVVVLAVGIMQARTLTRLRRQWLDHPGDTALATRIARTARSATVLRGAIGVLTLVLLGLGAVVAT